MRLAAVFILAFAACGGDDGTKAKVPFVDSGYQDGPVDARPPYWEPLAGNVKHWDIQLSPPFDLSASRDMYVLPLWDLVPKVDATHPHPTTVDYGDGTPLTIPPGALAGQIEIMHARRPQPKIICEIDAGSVDLVADPDAQKFPGFAASPPDNPTPPAAGSVIGWSTGLSGHGRWLDVRTGDARTAVLAIMAKRFALAKQLGCDGVLPDNMDMYRVPTAGGGAPYSGTGFTGTALSVDDEQGYYEAIATAAHAETLSTGMRGAYDQLSTALSPTFDWLIADRCTELSACADVQPFLTLHKAVLALDFDHSLLGLAQTDATVCSAQQTAGIVDGIVKDAQLTSASYFACADYTSTSGPSEGPSEQ
jgi:hypothetical protein